MAHAICLYYVWIILVCIRMIMIHSSAPETPNVLPIRIGLAVYDKSMRDLQIVINSALISVYDKSNVVFLL